MEKELDRLIYKPDPPTTLSVFPNGVSIASNATVPATNKLIIIKFCANIGNYNRSKYLCNPIFK